MRTDNIYSDINSKVLNEFVLRLKYTFSEKLKYIGTTNDKDSDLSNIGDLDVLVLIEDLNESLLTYTWNIISHLYIKYNIVIDARIYKPGDHIKEDIFCIHKQYLMKIFLNDLFGENPYKNINFDTKALISSCINELQKQQNKIISIIPRSAIEHYQIKEIAQCVFDAIRAFLIIENKPKASKADSCKLIEENYIEFIEVKSIYNGFINPKEIIKISEFIFDSLSLVKHLAYRVKKYKLVDQVLLINTPSLILPHPRSDYLSYDNNMPLGLVCLSSVLEIECIENKILDAYAENLGSIEIIDSIFSQEKIPKIIGFNTSSPNIHIVHDIARHIKRINRKITIVCGGPHASLAKEHTLAQKSIDYIVEGEGEIPFTNLVKEIFNNKSNIDRISGVYKNVSGKIIGEPNATFYDLSKLPELRFDKLPIKRYYTVRKRLYFHTTRGCAFSCIYCSVPRCWGNKVREIPINVLFDQIEKAVKKFRPDEIQIVDDNFSHRKGKIIENFCLEKKRRKLEFKWKCQVRADQLTDEIIKIMAENGCFEIDFGIESGNKKIQKYIRKNLNLTEAIAHVKYAHENNIFTKSFFMLGFPEEDFEQITDTINYSIDLKENGLNDVAFFPVMPFPGTEISNLTGKTVFQGAEIDEINFTGNTYSHKKLRKYSAKPQISLNNRFNPDSLRLLVKFAYQRFDYKVKIVDLEKEFEDFCQTEEELLYIN